jgi:hypothetical protein
MPGASGQGYGQHNFRQGAADRAGGSREEASSGAGRCMAVKIAAVGPGTVEAVGPGEASERRPEQQQQQEEESMGLLRGHGPLEVSKCLSQPQSLWSQLSHASGTAAAKSAATKAAQQQDGSAGGFQQSTGPLWRFHLLRHQVVILMFIEIGMRKILNKIFRLHKYGMFRKDFLFIYIT